MSKTTHILLLGGTGRIGQLFTTSALAAGYQITALVRRANSLPSHENLSEITGSPTSTEDITRALAAIASSSSSSSSSSTSTSQPIAIVSTLGQTRTNPSNPWSTPTSPAGFMTEAIQAVTTAIRDLDLNVNLNVKIRISKLLILSAFGTGDSWGHMHWALRWVMANSNMKRMVEDHNGIIEVVGKEYLGKGEKREIAEGKGRKLEVPFVLVRPVMLKFNTEGEVPEVKEYGNGREGMGMMLGCDVRSLVGFMVEVLKDDRFDGMMPVIST